MHQHRYIEIDIARSLAVAMMLLFHYVFDLRAFYGWNINVFSGPWFWVGRVCALLFLILVGVSFVISWHRTVDAGAHKKWWHLYRKYLRRGLIVLGCGMLITIVTYVLMGQNGYIRFGVLHLIGTSLLILPLLAFLREGNILLGIAFLILPLLGFPSPSPSPFLLPLGFHSPTFSSLDYYPLFPWLGVILIGAGMGHLLYVRFPNWRKKLPLLHHEFPRITWAGKNALLIYMIHQPILLTILWIFEKKGP